MPANIKHLRAQYYETTAVPRLSKYHVREHEIAGVFGTETYHPPNFNIPKHSHNLASFYVVLEGSLTEFSAHKARDVGTCSVVFTPPDEIHSNTFHARGGRCFLVELTQRWMERLAISDLKLDSPMDAKSGDLAMMAIRLYKEFRDADAVSSLSIEGIALEVLAAFCRQSQGLPEGYLPSWLRSVREILDDRFSETLTLREIALQVGVHPVHLARAFRKRYRCTVGEYQRRLRIDHSSRQLIATDLSLTEIALSAGFADQAHFSRVFKERTGLTPSSFRKTFDVS
jgi:AraC family transcriptional regulator